MTDEPKPDWWREEIHGHTALVERKRQRQMGLLNKPKKPAGGLAKIAQFLRKHPEVMKRLTEGKRKGK